MKFQAIWLDCSIKITLFKIAFNIKYYFFITIVWLDHRKRKYTSNLIEDIGKTSVKIRNLAYSLKISHNKPKKKRMGILWE